MTEKKAHVKLNGKDYPLVGPSEFTLGDLVDCENHFGASYGTDVMDARKLAGVLYISVRRVDATVQPSDLRNLTGAQIEEIGQQLAKWQTEDDAGPPPQEPAPSESENASNGSSSDSSRHASVRSDDAPSLTGTQPSATGAI